MKFFYYCLEDVGLPLTWDTTTCYDQLIVITSAVTTFSIFYTKYIFIPLNHNNYIVFNVFNENIAVVQCCNTKNITTLFILSVNQAFTVRTQILKVICNRTLLEKNCASSFFSAVQRFFH